MQNDRRTFLKNVGGVTAAVVASSVLNREATAADADREAAALSSASDSNSVNAAAALERPPGRVRIGLFLGKSGDQEQTFAGWLTSVDGGSAEAQVVTQKFEGSGAKKHIAGVKYEDISVSFGASMSKAFYDWIKESFDGKIGSRNGTIVAADFDSSIVDTLAFEQALISEIGFPALDAGSKDSVKMTVKLTPGTSKFELGDASKFDFPKLPQTRWTSSNFKIEIEGLDATTQISKIEPIVIKQDFVVSDEGYGKIMPGQLELSNLVLSLPQRSSGEFLKWHEEIVSKIGSDYPDTAQKGGWISFATSGHQEEFLKLSFSNLGIFKFSPPAPVAFDPEFGWSPEVRQVKAELFVESIKFDYKATWG